MAEPASSTAPNASAAAEAPRRPRSPAELFWAFTSLAMQGFGGVLPVAQRALVEQHRWLTAEQFLELLSISQVLPGPNIVNMALILGDRHFGWRGALAAGTGVLLAPLVVVLMLAVLAQRFSSQPLVADALRGMGVVAAGLVLSTAVRLAKGLKRNAMGLWVCGAFMLLTVTAIAVLRWPLVSVVLGLGGAAFAVAWWRLKP